MGKTQCKTTWNKQIGLKEYGFSGSGLNGFDCNCYFVIRWRNLRKNLTCFICSTKRLKVSKLLNDTLNDQDCIQI